MKDLEKFEIAAVSGGTFASGEASGEAAGKAVGTAIHDVVSSYNLAKAAGWVMDAIEAL